MPRKFLATVIIPLLGVAKSAGVFISTIASDDDPFADMLLRPLPDGTFAINAINYNLIVCPQCTRHGIEVCDHMRSQMPRWLDPDKSKNLQRIFHEARAEMQGTVGATDMLPAFNPKTVKALFDAPRFKHNAQIPLFVIGVDPSGGGVLSNFTMVTIYQDVETDFLVVGWATPKLFCVSVSMSLCVSVSVSMSLYVCLCVCVRVKWFQPMYSFALCMTAVVATRL